MSICENGVLTGPTIGNSIAICDTLISHSSKNDGIRALKAKDELDLPIYPMAIPPPVYSVVVEPQTLGNIYHMEKCLKQLVTEDPSLQLFKESETG